MANNRMYLVNTETGQKILLAKSFGSGWELRNYTDDTYEESLQKFFSKYACIGDTAFKILYESKDDVDNFSDDPHGLIDIDK